MEDMKNEYKMLIRNFGRRIYMANQDHTKIILKWMVRKQGESGQEWDHRKYLVNTVTDLWLP
jgi:hypothetical protein